MKLILVFGLIFVCVLLTKAAPPKESEEDSHSEEESKEQHQSCGKNHHDGRPHNHRHHPHHRHNHPHHHHPKGHGHGHWHRHSNHTDDSSEEHQDSGVKELPTVILSNYNADDTGNLVPSTSSAQPDFNKDASNLNHIQSVGADSLGPASPKPGLTDVGSVNNNSAGGPSDSNVNLVTGDSSAFLDAQPETTTLPIFDIRTDQDVENLAPGVINNINIHLNKVEPE